VDVLPVVKNLEEYYNHSKK